MHKMVEFKTKKSIKKEFQSIREVELILKVEIQVRSG